MKMLMRFRCARHGGCRVYIGADTTYFVEDTYRTDHGFVMDAELMYCEGREGGPDPVEDPDCSESWTVSMRKIKDEEDGGADNQGYEHE